MKEIYISTDVETNGPIPGEYSMLSLGSVALGENGKILGKFYKKLIKLPSAKKHKQTMDWWKENKEAYKEATSNAKDPKKVMNDYIKWLKKIKSKNKSDIFFLGWPANYDFMFVFWYIIKFVEEYKQKSALDVPFGFHAIDIRSYAMGHLKTEYNKTRSKYLPKKWFPKKEKHTHKAIDDALYQGLVFTNMLKENRK